MALYLVDYENVHDTGVVGVEKLTANDKVILFCSANTKTISMDTHISIAESKAVIEHIKTTKTAKNYLDFQLSTMLGYLIGKGEKGPCYIISKDTGFDSVIDYWENKSVTVKRQEQISCEKKSKSQETKCSVDTASNVGIDVKLPETKKKKIREALKKAGINIEGANYTKIYKSILGAKKASEYKSLLDEQFKDAKRADAIYKYTQVIACDYFKDMKDNRK